MSAKSGAVRMMRRFKFKNTSWVASLVALFLFHHTCDAAQAQIFSGPVTSAMGGAGRAGTETTEVMFLNPAAVALGTGFETGFLYTDGYTANGEHNTGLAAALVENDASNFFPGGFAYVQSRKTAPGLAWNERYFFGALGKSFSTGVTLGLSVYHLTQEIEDGETYTHLNGALGVTVTPHEGLGLVYVVSNFVRPDKDAPLELRPIMQQSIGVTWMMPQLMRVNFDVVRWEKMNPDKKGILQAGAEIRASEFGVFRFGGEVDDILKRNSLSMGLGFIGPRLTANYSFSKPLEGTNGAMHSVDMRVPF